MTDYRIVCTELENANSHRHVVGIGTGTDPNQALERWTVAQVRRAMSSGNRFYTYVDGSTVMVEPYTCRCGYTTIRSSAGSTLANNIDRLRECT